MTQVLRSSAFLQSYCVELPATHLQTQGLSYLHAGVLPLRPLTVYVNLSVIETH